MKKKILIMTAAALLTLGLATVSAQSPAPAEQAPEEIIYEIVEPQRYEAGTVDADGNVTLDVELFLRGDVDLNGDIGASDLTALARHLAYMETITDSVALGTSDTKIDNSVDAADLTALAKYLAYMIDDFE
ncbi:MAG: hypothetical protein E7662_00555 [Ruminococcaceae bacterium]|nr:hypothetical protein [Oscillospiraceae bacterium]